jgi:DNA-binding NarL/FixJ family response regulator
MEKSNKKIFSIMQPRGLTKKTDDLSVSCCIINNFEIFREGLVSVLSAVPGLKNTVGYTKHGYLQLEDSSDIDLVICDVEYDGKLDIELIKTIRKLNPESTIIVYTHIKNNEYRNYAIHCGADFFIFKEEKFNLIEHLISGISRKIIRKQTEQIQKKRVNE